MSRRAMYISAERTVMDDGTMWNTPPDALNGNLGAFLDRMGRTFKDAGEGVIVLNAAGAAGVGHPVEPAAHALWVGGWKCSAVNDWSTWHGEDRPTLRVCLTHLMKRPVQIPLWANTPEETLAGLALWHQLTGRAYVGTPGMAATAVLSELAGHGKGSPTWKPSNPGPDGFEDDYHTDQWRSPRTGMQYVHGYDANRAYIASAANVLVAKTMLRRGPRVYDPRQNLAGWWLCELPAWTNPRLPDPAGYGPHGKTVRWITTPRLALLEELTQEGIYGGVRILESFTAQGSTLLRPVAHRLRDAYAGKDPTGRVVLAGHHAERVEAVRQTIKDGGRAMLGAFNSPSNFIYRPDWWYSTIAMDAANRWRKIYRTTASNRWPAVIDVDNVWYPSNEANWRKAAPPGWEIDDTGLRLGQYKHGGTRAARARRAREETTK